MRDPGFEPQLGCILSRPCDIWWPVGGVGEGGPVTLGGSVWVSARAAKKCLSWRFRHGSEQILFFFSFYTYATPSHKDYVQVMYLIKQGENVTRQSCGSLTQW